MITSDLTRTTARPGVIQRGEVHHLTKAKEGAKERALVAFCRTLESLTDECNAQDLSGWRIVVDLARKGAPGVSHVNNHLPFEGAWGEGVAKSPEALGQATAISVFRNLTNDMGTVFVFFTLEWRYDSNTKPHRVYYLSTCTIEGKPMVYDEKTCDVLEIATHIVD